ncbi:S-adenosyl-L-methionine-dependent methyltransferase [Stereum hirsutum FP-91666 SS1]|uniref:S-adenosyl-L-methionine-dependent methyltransferase n=1 Tax=Stereum hirsutum (strain FP-91666) TaxID=721885 RepID=UPI000440A079|nr:S-adenosyl-L-methionine-dependent methyltransferase [Stereum hirsutum FP-91666 SS1]EIM91130.1 S-adenosyl-L-methionine-dependent methyltransferase [Stereum hirsutum FP-91666 SS1]
MPSPAEDLRALLSLINTSAEEAISIYEAAGSVPTLDTIEAFKVPEGNISLKRTLRTLEAACNQLTSTLMPPDLSVYTRCTAAMDAVCTQIVINKKIPDILLNHSKGLHISDIASETQLEEGKLLRIMRFLAAKHCFREVEPATFTNNPLSLSLLSDTPLWAILAVRLNHFDPIAIGNFFEALTSPEYSHSYSPSKAPFSLGIKDRMPDGTAFEWLQKNPEMSALFNRSMMAWFSMTDVDIVDREFPWKDLPEGTTVCDIGCGNGFVPLRISKAHPHLRFTMQDREYVLEDTKALWEKEHPSPQTHANFVPIDFFKSPPVMAQDIYYVGSYGTIRQVIHDWPRDECIAILKNIRMAMKEGSRLLLHKGKANGHGAANGVNGKTVNGVSGKALNGVKGDDKRRSRWWTLGTKDRATFKKSQGHTHLLETLEANIDRAPYPLLPNYGYGAARSGFLDLEMLVLFNASERTLEQFKDLGEQAGLRFVKVWHLAETGLIEFARD